MIIHLPSNSSQRYFPDNELGNYRTKLCNPVNLVGEYEVALSEMLVPKLFYNISSDEEAEVLLTFPTGTDNRTAHISKGSYTSIVSLLEEIQSVVNSAKPISTLNNVYLMYVERTRKVRLDFNYASEVYNNSFMHSPATSSEHAYPLTPQNVNTSHYTLITGVNFSEHLRSILGMERDGLSMNNGGSIFPVYESYLNMINTKMMSQEDEVLTDWITIIPPLEPKEFVDLNAGRHLMYVYTDIIENTMVGDYSVPLLRTVPIPGLEGSDAQKLYTPNQLQYYKVNTNRLDVIRIYITNSRGDNLPFTRGMLNVTLRFRRVGDSD